MVARKTSKYLGYGARARTSIFACDILRLCVRVTRRVSGFLLIAFFFFDLFGLFGGMR